MYQPGTELTCGIFDSSVLRKNTARSASRNVTCYELELFHTQAGTSYINSLRYPTARGMIVCAKPGQTRYSDFPIRCSFVRITATGKRNAECEALMDSLPDCIYCQKPEETEELFSLFAKLSARITGSAPQELNLLRSNAAFLELLYRIARISSGQTVTASLSALHPGVRHAHEYINEHYTERCSLQTLADTVGLSPNYLHSVFTECFGMTPYAYVMSRRIRAAQKRIAAGEKTMMEIALELGFCSQSHFNKVFKEQTGLTPVAYRKKLWEQY